MFRRWAVFAQVCLLLGASGASAQGLVGSAESASTPPDSAPRTDTRTELPAFLNNSYFSVAFGSIEYPFSKFQLEPGFHADRIKVPHAGIRVMLLGHRFHKYLSGQVSYLRPVEYVVYSNVNGTQIDHSVWIAVGEITIKSQLPLNPRWSIYGETGVSTTTRKGFKVNGQQAVDDTHIASMVFGGGLEFKANDNWDFVAGATYSGAHPRHRQPEMLFTSLGFRYNMRKNPESDAAPPVETAYLFPEHVVQLGVTTKALGYGVNNLVSGKVPIFWGGDVRAASGAMLRYQRNVYHTRKVFSLDLGGSVAYWSSHDAGNRFLTLSAYPLLRFTLLRRPAADYFVSYSFAGPTLISKAIVDHQDTGTHFTFQDMFGVGAYVGKNRRVLAEINIGHYSNGNFFPQNPGIKIPLTFNVGYTF